MNKHYIIPIFVPHFGCKYNCVFCNQKKITNASTNIRVNEVHSTIKKYLNYFRENSFIEIAFYGGSFTAIDIEIQKELLGVAVEYKELGIVDEIRLSTRPDAIDIEILENLKDYQVDTIELGVQSLDEEVLKASARGHSISDVYNAVNLIKSYNFKLGLQMMIGLPKDSCEKTIKTAYEFIKLKPNCVRIYPTLVIKNTILEKLVGLKRYEPLNLEEAIEVSTIVLMMFYLNNINVIRVGLQTTENIQMGKDVLAGPFHPAFRQLVESNIYKKIISYYIEKQNIDTHGKTLQIGACKQKVSDIAGQGSSNSNYFINKYKFKSIKFIDKDENSRCLSMSIGSHCDILNINEWMKAYLFNDLLFNNKQYAKIGNIISRDRGVEFVFEKN